MQVSHLHFIALGQTQNELANAQSQAILLALLHFLEQKLSLSVWFAFCLHEKSFANFVF